MVLGWLLACGGGLGVVDEAAYFVAPAASLRWEGGEELGPHDDAQWASGAAWSYLGATAALEGEGELFLAPGGDGLGPIDLHTARIAIRVPRGAGAEGVVFAPDESALAGRSGGEAGGVEHRMLRFELEPAELVATREEFLRARLAHDERLLRLGAAGGAWWRMRADEDRRELGEPAAGVDPAARPLPWQRADIDDTLSLFSGGRALAENLQLDRLILPGPGGEATVPLDSIAGIGVPSFDWAPLVEGLEPELDPLAAWVPADQHAVFFPSLDAALAVLEECERDGSLWFDLVEPSSDDRDVRARYERQLCLPLGPLAQALGKLAIRSVALTGSDPCFRTGTDVAVLLESPSPELVEAFLATQHAQSGGAVGEGTAAGVAWRSAVAPDDSVRSFVARVEGAVVVTNSLQELERVLAAGLDPSTALARSDEYRFFRDRYRRGGDEAALVVLTDATIRRWCGPRWRIGFSRRTQAAAVLADLEVRRLAGRGEGPGAGSGGLAAGVLGDVVALEDGLRSEGFGSTRFLRPVIELDLERVTEAEAQAYARYRVRYQSNWQQFFDPIALRLSLPPQGLSADLTVMPLIAGTEYRDLTRWCGTAHLEGRSFRPADSLASFGLAIDTESPEFRELGSFVEIGPRGGPGALSWVGGHLELWAERDPWWDEYAAAQASSGEAFVERAFHRLPVALAVPSKDPLRLAAFLTGLRALSDGAAPDLVVWETREHAGQPYVCVRQGEALRGSTPFDELQICYAARADALVVTLREDLLQRALERLAETPGATAPAPTWRGESTALELDRVLLSTVFGLAEEEIDETARAQAWAALPILNEWRRRFPGQDPTELYRRVFGAGMPGGAGAAYVWNEGWRSFESTAFGLPQALRSSGGARRLLSGIQRFAAGLTFEHDGLRARADLERAPR